MRFRGTVLALLLAAAPARAEFFTPFPVSDPPFEIKEFSLTERDGRTMVRFRIPVQPARKK